MPREVRRFLQKKRLTSQHIFRVRFRGELPAGLDLPTIPVHNYLSQCGVRSFPSRDLKKFYARLYAYQRGDGAIVPLGFLHRKLQ